MTTQMNIADLLRKELEAAHAAVPAPTATPATQPVTQDAAAAPARAMTTMELSLEALGILPAYAIYYAGPHTAYEERTISDIMERYARWGNISPKQIDFVRNLLAKIATRPEREAAKAAERAAALDAPTGRMEIEGTVVSSKIVESRFGSALKMLLQSQDGWRVWGTVPAAIGSVDRGDTVRLTATLERSQDDPKFGFYSRPTNARVIARRQEVAA